MACLFAFSPFNEYDLQCVKDETWSVTTKNNFVENNDHVNYQELQENTYIFKKYSDFIKGITDVRKKNGLEKIWMVFLHKL